MLSDPLFVLVGLVAAGVAAQGCATLLRLPSIVTLLATGLLLGPVTGLLDPADLFGDLRDPFVSLAVALVLFEGGLSLKIEEARRLGWPLLALVLGALVVSFALTTLLGHGAAGLSWPTAAVLGAILVVTGPTVIKPMLRQARLSQRPARLLRWEGIINDPLGAVLAVLVIEVVLLGQFDVSQVSFGSVAHLLGLVGAAGLGGAGLGWLLGTGLSRGWVAEHLKIPVIVAGVLVGFAGAEALLHETGLLAVTTMGVVLANTRSPSMEAIRHFKEDVTTLLIAFLFLVLASELTFDDLAAITPGAVALILGVLFVVRPVAVWLSLSPTRLPWREKLLIGWIAPRGVVAAAMAGALSPALERAGYEDARLVLPVLFGVVLLTVTLHGFTIGPLARRLGLAGDKGGGLLVVSASTWAVDMARSLSTAGVDVLLVDDDYRGVSQARMRGLDTLYGDVLAEDTLDELPFERVNWVLAATQDDTYNNLVCLSLAKTLGAHRVLQLSPHDGEEDARGPHLMGRVLWGAGGTYDAISSRYWSGRHFKSTELTAEFGWDDFREQNPEALVLFGVMAGRLRALALDDAPDVGARIVYLP